MSACDVAEGSGEEDEGVVGLVLSCDFTEENDDGSYSWDHRPVESVDHCVDDEVNIFEFHSYCYNSNNRHKFNKPITYLFSNLFKKQIN